MQGPLRETLMERSRLEHSFLSGLPKGALRLKHAKLQPTFAAMKALAWAAASLLVLCIGCGRNKGGITPTTGPITESAYASGVVKARGQYQVYTSATGPVTEWLVHKGDTVKAGTALMRIDDRSSLAGQRSSAAQLQLLQRNAAEDGPVLVPLRQAVQLARDKYALDSTNYARQQALWAQQIGSRNDLEQRQLAFSNSRTAWVQARKNLDQVRAQLHTELDVAANNAAISTAGQDDRTPRSLIAGVVYDLLVEPGEMASPQKPVAIVGSATNLYIELAVDEKDIPQLQPGQRVFLALEAYDSVFTARVSRIVPIMDPRTRTFTVEAEFATRPAKLFPNSTAEANIELRHKDHALTIPADYLVDDGHVRTGKDRLTAVTTGLKDLQRVEITGGIDSTTTLYKP